jgi:hypothetical protein
MSRFLPLPTLSLLGIVNICFGAIGVFAFGSVLLGMAALLVGLFEHYQISLLTIAVRELAYDPFGWCVLVLAVLSELLLLIAGIGCLRRSRFQGWVIGNVYVLVSLLEGILVLAIANEVLDVLENAVFRIFFFALPLINGVLINLVLKQDFTKD